MLFGSEARVRRAGLLRGRLKAASSHIRPPWSVQGSAQGEAFNDLCTRCNQCIDACPEGIITKDTDGFPTIQFAAGECTFCAECVDVCTDNALVKTGNAPWAHKLAVSAECLSVRGIMCRSCMDTCEPRSITFHLATKGRSLPVIDQDTCTGCGACIAPCPVNAITIQS